MTEANQDNAHVDFNTLSKEEYKLLSKAEKKELECSVQMSDEEIKEAREACENCCSYYYSVFKLYNIDEEDIISDTMLKLHRFRHLYRGESKWTTFVYRVASNSLKNSIQSAKRQNDAYSCRKEYLEDQEGETTLESILGYEYPETVEEQMLYEERKEMMYHLIERLPPDIKEVILMYCSGTRYKEMAEQLGRAKGSCQSQWYRGKQMLIQMINEEFQDYK